MYFDHATIVDRARDYYKRLSLRLGTLGNVGNERIDIPSIRKSFE